MGYMFIFLGIIVCTLAYVVYLILFGVWASKAISKLDSITYRRNK